MTDQERANLERNKNSGVSRTTITRDSITTEMRPLDEIERILDRDSRASSSTPPIQKLNLAIGNGLDT